MSTIQSHFRFCSRRKRSHVFLHVDFSKAVSTTLLRLDASDTRDQIVVMTYLLSLDVTTT